ncbi:uncharacterized protein FA14DRAFT_159099 [Meira miltonrushii]|uniref:Uncharacterized protein n=1 Tax=Meira miltonrushii TaxID=1280837 RepID=A0A316VI08_9BASI|nr:uncharacterized protein FA14DRAFT_159099 [Meira miltonrushii]PWN36678.1 hypothetical protein FA14DRAFT_159099 [Meira miltonrushii]
MTSRLTSSFVSQDAQDPELGTPSRSLTGPSRRKSESRAQRLSLGKPYARSSLGPSGKQGFDSPSSAHTVTPNRQTSKRFGNATSPSTTIRTPQQNANTPSSKKGGLLSGLRQAIFSRPLSWLQSGAAQSDSLPTSRSSNSIGTEAEKGVAAQRNAQSLSRSNTFATHEFGTTSSRPSAFVAPPPSTPSRSPYLGNTVGLPSRSGQLGLSGNGSAIQDTPKSANAHRSPSPARSSASAIIRSHGRQRLSVEPSNASRYGVASSASLLGTPGYRRSGSQRGDGSVASGGSASQAHSSASFAYGFGSERRLGGLTTSASLYGGAGSASHSPLASTSYNRLPSRSPFAIQQRRSLGGSAAASEMGSLHGRASPGVRQSGQGLITTPVRPVSMFGGDFHGSRAGSVANSRASSRGTTPKRREWSSLKLAPPSVRRSEGEELMQEYLAMRDAATNNDMRSIVHPALNDTRMAEDDPNAMSRATTQNGSLKRGASMSIDGDSMMSDANPRKRQMVWDSELGFISRQEQIAARPPKPTANNEAERLLNALEGMRTPLGDARRDSAARSSHQPINIPLAVPSSDSSRRSGAGDYVKAVSPYARAMRKQKMQHTDQPASVGLRSRLRKEIAKANSDAMSVGSEDQEVENSDEEESEASEDEEEEEEEEIEEPPRRRQAGKSAPQKPQTTQKRTEAPVQMEDEPRTLRSGKVISTQVSPPKRASQVSPQQEKVAPMSRARFSVSNSSAANKQRAERQNPFSSPNAAKTSAATADAAKAAVPSRDKFSIKMDDAGSSTDSSENRRSSSLRQGAEKTSRSHTRSGRVGIDDDDDDAMEDSPSAEELSKIKLPTNLFPQGFSFSSAPSTASSTASSPQVKPLTEQPASNSTEDASKAEGSSLLSRMGGFAAPEATQAAPGFSLSSPSPPTFSLSSPKGGIQTSAAPLNKPAFSFQPAISSPLAGGSGASSPQPTSSSASPAPSSNFFTAPSAEEKKKQEQSATPPAAAEGQKPIPNFFASSLAKSSTPAPEAPKTPAFSFGTPASTADTTSDTSKPAFSFGKPAESTPAPSTTSFSFGNNASQASPAPTPSSTSTAPAFSFGAPAASKPAETSKPAFSGFEAPKASAPSGSFSGFGTPSSAPAPSTAPTPSFSFGAPSATSSEDGKKKRGQDDEKEAEEPQAKRSFTGFGAPAASPAPAASTSSPGTFTFGAPASGSNEEKKSTAFSFGASSQPSNNETKPAMSFGAPSQASSTPSTTNSTGGFGGFGSAASSASQAAKPAFSFGAPSSNNNAPSTSAGSSPFTFGAKTDTNASQPTNNAAAGGTFAFGQAGNTGSTSFGQQSSTPFGSQNNSRQQSPAPTPFTFGAPAAQQNGTSNTGFGGFGQQTAPSSGATPSFNFGAGAQSNPTQPQSSAGGSNGMSFSFSMPMSNATSNAPSFGGGSQMNGATGTPGTPPAFVFGAPSTGNQNGPATPTTPGGAGGFNFGAANPAPSGMGGGGSLFNIGAPSSNAPAGNRPVRGMPSRRKK